MKSANGLLMPMWSESIALNANEGEAWGKPSTNSIYNDGVWAHYFFWCFGGLALLFTYGQYKPRADRKSGGPNHTEGDVHGWCPSPGMLSDQGLVRRIVLNCFSGKIWDKVHMEVSSRWPCWPRHPDGSVSLIQKDSHGPKRLAPTSFPNRNGPHQPTCITWSLPSVSSKSACQPTKAHAHSWCNGYIWEVSPEGLLISRPS